MHVQVGSKWFYTNGYLYHDAFNNKYICHATNKKVLCNHEEVFSFITENEEATAQAAFRRFLDHVRTEHKVEICSHCNTLISRSGLRKHQGTDECKCSALSNRLKTDGYSQFDQYSFTQYFDYKLNEVLSDSRSVRHHLYSEDEDWPLPWYGYGEKLSVEDDELRQQSFNAFNRIKKFLDIRSEKTIFRKGGWGRSNRILTALWARESVVTLMRMVNRLNGVKPLWTDEAVSLLNDYIDADPEQREAIRGTLELACDAKNF